jgi:hypothetical protein
MGICGIAVSIALVIAISVATVATVAIAATE